MDLTDFFPCVTRARIAALFRTIGYPERVAELLAGAAARGELREGVDPEAAAVLLISAYEGLRHYWLLDPENFTPERLIAAAGGLFTTDVRINVEALVDAAPGLAPPLGIEVRRSGTRDDDVRPAGDGPRGGNR